MERLTGNICDNDNIAAVLNYVTNFLQNAVYSH